MGTVSKPFGILNKRFHLFSTCRHFQETQHTYSLELGTQRVWDYTGGAVMSRYVTLRVTLRHVTKRAPLCYLDATEYDFASINVSDSRS